MTLFSEVFFSESFLDLGFGFGNGEWFGGIVGGQVIGLGLFILSTDKGI